jgi:hypothetical protein
MLPIKKEYVVTAKNKKKAVLVDIDTFAKMEELIENYGLGRFMEEVESEKSLSLEEAKEHYKTLRKGPR